MRPLWIGLAATIAAALLTLAPSPCPGHEAGAADGARPAELRVPDTARLAIERARAEGRIGYDEEMLLKAYSLYAPDRLPEEYRRPEPDKCGTLLAREIEEALSGLPADIAAEIARLREPRPTDWDSYLNTTHFRIFYATSGPHMILGWPDTSYRDAVAAAAEKSWTDEVTNMGFREPPDDSSDPDGGGGSSHYDIYVTDTGIYYGWCQPSEYVSGGIPYDATSYVVIDHSYAGFGYPDATDPMKVTVAHEFCHACQFASNVYADGWYMECTSTWCEDMVYDDINDYVAYLPSFFNYPYASLEWSDGGVRVYGSCVWDFFLTEHVDPLIVPAVWARLETTLDTYGALDYCLGVEGTSLEEAFGTFAVWNWFTNSRYNAAYYNEGAGWPLVSAQATYGMYPVVDGGPSPGYYPDHLAWNYIHLNNPGYPENELDVTYDGRAPGITPNRAFINLKPTVGGTSEHGEITLDMLGDGDAIVYDWDDYGTVAVVVVNTSTTADDMVYTVGATKTTSPVAGSFYAAVTGREAVTLRWTLAEPWDIVSLDVERSTDGGRSYERLNEAPLEPASPGSYVDTDVRPGEELWYRLVAALTDGSEDIVEPGAVSARVDGTLGLSLSPPMPNPFRDSAAFEFAVPQDGGLVTLTVYDLAGRQVRTLVSGSSGRGRHATAWDGTDDRGHAVAAGVYFVTLEVPGGVVAQKAILLR